MNQKILFQETQRFNQWWIWLIQIILIFISFLGIYIQIIKGKPFGDNPMSDTGIILTSVVIIIFVLLFLSLNLKTYVMKDKIQFRFTPFHLKKQEYLLSEIEKMEVVKYSPIGEYGGWGIRGIGSNRAFNVKGNQGLRIYFKNGNKRLIGTQKPQELQKVIQELGFEN